MVLFVYYVVLLVYYVVLLCLAHNYQESACLSELRALKECCEKLKPEIQQYSVHCGGVVKN